MRTHGLSQAQSLNVFKPLFCSVSSKHPMPGMDTHLKYTQSIHRMLLKAKWWHTVVKDSWIFDLFDDSDRSTFRVVQSCNHYLHYLLAAKTEHTHSLVLRIRSHNFTFSSLNLNLQESLSISNLWFYINNYYYNVMVTVSFKLQSDCLWK